MVAFVGTGSVLVSLAIGPSIGIALLAIDILSGAAAVSLLRLVIFDVRLSIKEYINMLLITNTSHLACLEGEELLIYIE